MARRTLPASIDLRLVEVLATVIAERSVSRAAMRLATTQPQVSQQLARLRLLTGDPLLVRAGARMVPTEAALAMLPVAQRLLGDAAQLFSPARQAQGFSPATSAARFRIAASDYLDPSFLPGFVQRVRQAAPAAALELHALSADSDHAAKLAAGTLDLVVGNWLHPPPELHLARLFTDEVACLVAADHPAARQPRSFTAERYLAADHVAPVATHAGARGVIDEHLAAAGLERRIAVRAAHFGLIPRMVATSRLVLTTGRLFCTRVAAALGGLAVLRCPVPMPPLAYWQVWHERAHAAPAQRWLRDQVKAAAAGLGPARGGAA
jgi:DNA-binding transcriptional LysR family regulator